MVDEDQPTTIQEVVGHDPPGDWSAYSADGKVRYLDAQLTRDDIYRATCAVVGINRPACSSYEKRFTKTEMTRVLIALIDRSDTDHQQTQTHPDD